MMLRAIIRNKISLNYCYVLEWTLFMAQMCVTFLSHYLESDHEADKCNVITVQPCNNITAEDEPQQPARKHFS